MTQEELKRGCRLAQKMIERDGDSEFLSRCLRWGRQGTLTQAQLERLEILERTPRAAPARKKIPAYKSKKPITLATSPYL